jgi:hypothetical protein
VSQTRPTASSIDGVDSETLRWAIDAARLVRNPVFPGAVLAALLVVAGVLILAVSGWGISRQQYVALQLPFVISGGFGALGLITAGASLASVLGHRRDQAMADEEFGAVLAEMTGLAREELTRREPTILGSK